MSRYSMAPSRVSAALPAARRRSIQRALEHEPREPLRGVGTLVVPRDLRGHDRTLEQQRQLVGQRAWPARVGLDGQLVQIVADHALGFLADVADRRFRLGVLADHLHEWAAAEALAREPLACDVEDGEQALARRAGGLLDAAHEVAAKRLVVA